MALTKIQRQAVIARAYAAIDQIVIKRTGAPLAPEQTRGWLAGRVLARLRT